MKTKYDIFYDEWFQWVGIEVMEYDESFSCWRLKGDWHVETIGM